MEKTLYIKFSNERSPEYAIKTSIIEKDGVKAARKSPASAAAASHVKRSVVIKEQLEGLFGSSELRPVDCTLNADGSVDFPFVKGTSLEELMDAAIIRGEVSAAEEMLTALCDKLAALATEDFKETEDFRAIFGQYQGAWTAKTLAVTDIDLIPENVLIDDDNNWNIIDYEWTFDFPIPVNYVIYRVIHYYVDTDALRRVINSEALYKKYGITEDWKALFADMEKHFQKHIEGGTVAIRDMYDAISPGFKTVETKAEEVEALHTAVEQWKNKCAEMEASRSWRITKPIRKVSEALGNKRLQGASGPVQLKGSSLVYNIESIENLTGQYKVRGWVCDKTGADTEVYLTDPSGRVLEAAVSRNVRRDVIDTLNLPNEKDKCGFEISVQKADDTPAKVFINFQTAADVKKTQINWAESGNGCAVTGLLRQVNGRNIKKALAYSKKHGIKATIRKAVKKQKTNEEYGVWAKKQIPSAAVLSEQSKKTFAYAPKISIVIPAFNTDETYLTELINSITAQSYSNWELCLADASTTDTVEKVVKSRFGSEPRIKYARLAENKGISENTNAAIEMAGGDFIMFSDHDDLIAPDALFEIVSAINNSGADFIYTDEDKVSMDGTQYFEPNFKPDFNIDYLRSVNYICHIVVVKKTLLDKVGMLNPEYDGAQDFDFNLRCIEQAEGIYHIPKVLYHWRSHINSTAANPESKRYAYDAGQRAIQAHCERLGLDAEVTQREMPGFYKTTYKVAGEPMVSVLIPNKDHIDDLDKCIKSIFAKTTYKNFEIIVIENNSTEESTFTYYEHIQKQHENVQVVKWAEGFNFAAINNYGATFAKGEYLLLLNNDIEVITPDWLTSMVGYCQREDVGMVGAKLYYPDDTIQHAGVILGFGGIAGHIFLYQPRESWGFIGRAKVAQDLTAVTAACMLVKKSVYDEVGGMDETFRVAFNDVDFCMKVRSAGHLIVLDPDAELYHYESKSRGPEDSAEKIERFHGEMRHFQEKWTAELRAGDPYYNKNLSLENVNCTLRDNDTEHYDI